MCAEVPFFCPCHSKSLCMPQERGKPSCRFWHLLLSEMNCGRLNLVLMVSVRCLMVEFGYLMVQTVKSELLMVSGGSWWSDGMWWSKVSVWWSQSATWLLELDGCWSGSDDVTWWSTSTNWLLDSVIRRWWSLSAEVKQSSLLSVYLLHSWQELTSPVWRERVLSETHGSPCSSFLTWGVTSGPIRALLSPWWWRSDDGWITEPTIGRLKMKMIVSSSQRARSCEGELLPRWWDRKCVCVCVCVCVCLSYTCR